jgi:threonine dehydrogenase-like Zn-dependent dehydrogenase
MKGEPMFPGSAMTYPYTPGQPGHEAAGEVAELGPGARRLRVGARVAAWRDPGHERQGCYAQYVVMAEENLIEAPADREIEALAPLELAMCVQVSFNQLRRLTPLKGNLICISGLGPAGLVAIQIARSYGPAKVIGLDPVPARCKMALQLGADAATAPAEAPIPADRSSPSALDVALDCTGLKTSIEYLMDRTKEAVALFGVLREEVAYSFRHFGGLALLGYGSHNRKAADQAMELVRSGKLNLRPLVTHTLPLSQYRRGLELLQNKTAIKVCFLPWET